MAAFPIEGSASIGGVLLTDFYKQVNLTDAPAPIGTVIRVRFNRRDATHVSDTTAVQRIAMPQKCRLLKLRFHKRR